MHFTANFTPHLLNEIAYNENGNNITIDNTDPWKAPAGWSSDATLRSANPKGKIPAINVQSGGGPIGANMGSGNWPWQNWWRSNQIKDDLSFIHGRTTSRPASLGCGPRRSSRSLLTRQATTPLTVRPPVAIRTNRASALAVRARAASVSPTSCSVTPRTSTSRNYRMPSTFTSTLSTRILLTTGA